MELAGETNALCIVRGSINIDEFFHVPNIVHPGQTLSSTKYERRAGGKGANQAVAIAKAGGTVSLCGAIGTDGAWMLEPMAKFCDLRMAGLRRSENGLSGRAVIQLSPEGENSIVLFGGANTDPNMQSLCDEHLQSQLHTHLLVQNEIVWSSTLYALKTSHSLGATTFFNPSPMPSSEQLQTFPWKAVDWLIVNEGEAESLLHALGTNSQVSEVSNIPLRWSSHPTLTRAHSLLQSLRASPAFPSSVQLVCTLGALGVLVLYTGSEAIYVPAAKLDKPVVDTTGAGDCFTGYFVTGLMKRWQLYRNNKMDRTELEQIVNIAVKAAGVCVTRLGASESIPTREELIL